MQAACLMLPKLRFHLSCSLPQSGRPIRSYPAVTPLWVLHQRLPMSHPPTPLRQHPGHAEGWEILNSVRYINCRVVVLDWVQNFQSHLGWHVSGLHHRPGWQSVPPAGGAATLIASWNTKQKGEAPGQKAEPQSHLPSGAPGGRQLLSAHRKKRWSATSTS